MTAKQAETPRRRSRRPAARPQRRATTYRLHPHLQQGLALLGKVRKVSANQMEYQAATALYSRSLGLLKTALGKR